MWSTTHFSWFKSFTHLWWWMGDGLLLLYQHEWQLQCWKVRDILPGGLDPSEKYGFVNWDDDIPNWWENKSHVPVTTNQYTYMQLLSRTRDFAMFWSRPAEYGASMYYGVWNDLHNFTQLYTVSYKYMFICICICIIKRSWEASTPRYQNYEQYRKQCRVEANIETNSRERDEENKTEVQKTKGWRKSRVKKVDPAIKWTGGESPKLSEEWESREVKEIRWSEDTSVDAD